MLELIKPSNKKNKNKDMHGSILLYPECHPKDVSRNESQTMFKTTYKERFQDFLNTDECMIVYHNPDILRKLIIPSSLKQCEGIQNSANYHENKAGCK